jgi:DUF4097 and DUF4098 domain-containing protein YvlB
MKAAKIGLLLLILGFGGVIEAAFAVRNHIGIGPAGCRVIRGRFYGPSFTFDAPDERQPVPAATAVEVENAFGGVRMIQGMPGEVRISLRKVVFRQTEEAARAFADRVHVEKALTGAVLRIATNRRELEGGPDDVGFETHLEIAVPPDTPVKVQVEHGRVDVADAARAEITNSYEPVRVERVKGPVTLDSRHGDVSVAEVAGTLSLLARHGDVTVQDVQGASTATVEHGSVSVTRLAGLTLNVRHSDVKANDIRGDLEVHGEHTGIEARGVSGRAVLTTSFGGVVAEKVTGELRVKSERGSVEATDVSGAVFVEASFDDVVLTRIAGPVDVAVEHGGLEARGLDKGARVRVAGDEVVLEDFRGPVDVEAQRAGIQLVPAAALVEPVTARATHGAIHLRVPRDSRIDLEVAAERGEVQVDVPGLVLTRLESTRASGKLGGGGNRVSLTADHGDVRVEGSAAVAATNP